MKPTITFKHFLFSFLLISGSVFSQRPNTTPQNPDYIQRDSITFGTNTFEHVPEPLFVPSGATHSHLWWSGDNDFTFVPIPRHIHPRNSNGSAYSAHMTDIVTENYGNGGPPPLTYTFMTLGGNKSPKTVLNPGDNIYMQSYRNAVIDDTMYLIVTYKNPAGFGGELRFDVGSHAEIVDSMFLSHPHFLPNREQWNPGRNKCTLVQPSDPNVEQSILIPVLILPNEEDELKMSVQFYMEGAGIEEEQMEGINFSSINATVAESHDPNLMVESSDAKNKCDYRNGTIHYTVKFQNTGAGQTGYVRVECQLDNKVDLDQISGVTFPAFYNNQYHTVTPYYSGPNGSFKAIFHIDKASRKVIFEMNGLQLDGTGDSLVKDLERTRSQIEFDIKVKSNYIFGDATEAFSTVFFDGHPPIETNVVKTVCSDPLPMEEGKGGFQKGKLSFWDKAKWYLISGLALILGILGLRGYRKRRQK